MNLFRYLELEIDLAIQASNDEKFTLHSSAGQGLS